MKPIRFLAILITAGVVITTLGQSSATEPSSAVIGEELRGIREALDRLVALQRRSEGYQETELILKRLDLWVRRLEPLERMLSSAEAELRAGEEQLQMLERMRAEQEKLLEEEIRQGVDLPRSEARRELQDIERSRVGVEERTKATRMRMQQYENDLAAGQKKIAILDDRLLQLLGSDER